MVKIKIWTIILQLQYGCQKGDVMQSYKDYDFINDKNSAFSLSILSALGDRSDQQDNFGYSLKPDEGIIVVCDGMGGHNGGKIASSIAVDTLISGYENAYPVLEPINFLKEMTKNANKQIYSLLDENGNRLCAGSTIVSVIIKQNKLFWCSVGDSRAYLIRNNEFVQMTQDQNYQTVLDEKLNAGLIDGEQYNSEIVKGEALICYLGLESLNLIDYNESALELQPDDRVLIMSDGVYKILSDEEIFRLISNFNNISDANKAIEIKTRKVAQNKKINRDNMTIAIIKI